MPGPTPMSASSFDPVQDIKDRLNIIDILSPQVTLKKMGQNF
jgi:hypothetical protein